MQGAVLPKAQEMPVPKISTIKNVLSIGIFLAVVCYSAIYANNTFPISEGWNVNYVELIWHGKVPYRDFYYYLPPLNLLVDAVLWKLSFGSLLLYRLWWLLQRAAIFTLLFRLISRYINVVSTFVACLFSVMLCASSVYDLLGDYNQTVALLSILLLYCVIGFQEADTSKQRYTKIFGAGFMLGLVFLNKQTIFLASGIVYFAALAFYCIRKKDARFGWYCLFVVAGAVIPLAVAAAYLLANGAFFPFVEQVFMHTGGKGSIFTILFGGLSMALLKVQNWLIAVAAVLLAVNTGVSASREKALRAQSLLFPLLLLLLYVNFEKEISSFLELLGKNPVPRYCDDHNDIVTCFDAGTADALIGFCQGIQAASPVDSYAAPEPSPEPGYTDEVVMASGSFTQGSTIELSCDGPLREPYTCYLQGGLNFAASRAGVLLAIQKAYFKD